MEQLLKEVDVTNNLTLVKEKILEFKPSITKIKEQSIKAQNKIYQVWTDGACSKNPGVGGWAALLRWTDATKTIRNKKIAGYSPKTTNNKMELTAALKALKLLPDGCQVTLYSDSQYLNKGIKNWLPNWKKKNWKKADNKAVLNQELWQELDRQNNSKKINWVWIKGHNNNEENELCDKLAREQIKINN